MGDIFYLLFSTFNCQMLKLAYYNYQCCVVLTILGDHNVQS